MPEQQPQRKMINIDVVETSAVDHPAHLAEGWIVCKSATAQDVEGIFGPLTTEGNATMATNDPTAPTVESLTKALADRDTELAAVKADLVKATTKPEAPATQEDMLKALPEPVRAMLAKAEKDAEDLRKQADEDRAELVKERDARLDERAVTEAADMFKSVAIDAKTVAPALRRLAIINADLHKAVTEALKAADAQLFTAGVFKEFGRTTDQAAPALSKIDAATAEVMKAEPTLTKPAAMAKAVALNPSLYDDYQNEKAGN